MTNDEEILNRDDTGSSFVIRSSSFRGVVAFTLLELLIVMTIIIVLAGITIATMGYVQGKARRSRAEAEIAAFSAALENYKADNGVYPRDAASTDLLAANIDPQGGNPASFVNSCRFLYKQLAGDSDGNPATTDATNDTKNYVGAALKPNMLNPKTPGPNTFIQDPFGNSYGYSTAKAADPNNGYNPTFDLWSTCGETGKKPSDATFQQYQARWVKNW